MLIVVNIMYSYYFDSSGYYQRHQKTVQETSEKSNAARKLCCCVCGNPVTSQDAGCEMDGKHEHIKINPQQQQFIFRCFSVASGCELTGLPTMEFTWFTGHSWRIVRCGQCGTQLGWFFEGASHFFALICCLLAPCKLN